MSLFLDHIFIDGNENDLLELSKRGFTASENIVEHPGSKSRFIQFKFKEDWQGDINPQFYLELIDRNKPSFSHGLCLTTGQFDQIYERFGSSL